jgi:fructosamine-3-kinase
MFHELSTNALRLAGDTTQLHALAQVGGGSISQAFRLRTERGEYLLKLGGGGLPGFFAAEARGLALLAATRAVRVPAVLAYHDAESTADNQQSASERNIPRPGADRGSPVVDASFILLEWLAAPQADQAAVAEVLGSQLAALHRTTAPAYGLDHENYIGATPQPNGWMPSWLAFFRERRLGFQAQLARQNGHLRGERAQRMERLLDRLGEWIDDHTTQPALLHGDLWRGNFIVGPGWTPALIDPAAYHGDREADLAMTRLFGGFAASFYWAYESAWPLPAGWQDRVDLYNLYHLLNHVNLFGESYGAEVDAVLRRYVG